MGVEWTEISYLRGQKRMPVFTYYLASAFSPAVTWIEVDKHAERLQVLLDGGRCVSWLTSCIFIKHNLTEVVTIYFSLQMEPQC